MNTGEITREYREYVSRVLSPRLAHLAIVYVRALPFPIVSVVSSHSQPGNKAGVQPSVARGALGRNMIGRV